MSLYHELLTLLPELTSSDFDEMTGTIKLQNDSNGVGDYIKEWNHSTVQKPTLDEIS